MRTTQDRIYKIYTPLSVSVTANLLGTQAKQSFKSDESGDVGFNPNRRLTPTVILPVVRVYDKDGIFRSGIANDLLADIHWYDGDTEITSGTDYSIDTSYTSSRGQLTIYRNTPAGSAQRLRFEAFITDTRRNENVKVCLNGIVLSSTVSSGDVYEVRLDQPSACYYNPLDNETAITVNATAFRGNKGQAAIDYELRKSIYSGGVATDRAILDTDYEIISSANGTYQFDLRMINEESYIVIGKVNNIEVDRKAFTIKRKYPSWNAIQSGTSDMVPGQTVVGASVDITASNGLVNNAINHFSIQPHTVTSKNGDINWGERSQLSVNPYIAGFVDGGYIGIYFEVNEIPALDVALDEDSNLLIDEETENRILI